MPTKEPARETHDRREEKKKPGSPAGELPRRRRAKLTPRRRTKHKVVPTVRNE